MPLYYADQVKFKVDLYNVNPSIFSLDQVDELEQAATEFGVKFQRNIAAEEAKLEPTVISTTNQFISGLFEGFTTFGYAGEPGSEAEAIANKLGHLIGFVPGILGGPAVLGAKASLKVGTLLGKKAASATIAKGFTKFAKIVSGDSKIVGDLALKSVPMIGADKAIDVLGKLVKKNTSLEAMKLFAPGSVGRGMVRGAAHLGIASGISSWKGGVDEMMDSMVSGAGFGAAFAGMGNFINLQKMIADPKTLKQANTVVRGIAGSLMMGLPSTMQDAPTSMQVYEYLLGGYFGATSASSHEVEAMKFMKGKKSSDFNNVDDLPGYARLSDATKKIVLDQALYSHGKMIAGDIPESQVVIANALSKITGDSKTIKEKLDALETFKKSIPDIADDLVADGFRKLDKGEEVTGLDANGEPYLTMRDDWNGTLYTNMPKGEQQPTDTNKRNTSLHSIVNIDSSTQRKIDANDNEIRKLRGPDGSIPKENIQKFRELQKKNKDLKQVFGKGETKEEYLLRLRTLTLDDLIKELDNGGRMDQLEKEAVFTALEANGISDKDNFKIRRLIGDVSQDSQDRGIKRKTMHAIIELQKKNNIKSEQQPTEPVKTEPTRDEHSTEVSKNQIIPKQKMTSTFEGFPARMKKIDTGLLESVTEVIDRLSGVEVSDIIESIQINDNGIDLGQMNKALLTRTLKERGYDKEVVNRVVSEATSTRMILDGMKSLISKYGEKVSKKPSKKEEAKTVIEEKITVETIGEDHSEDVLHTDSKGNKITRGVPEIDYSVKSVEPEIPKNPIEKALKRGIVNPDDVIEHKRGWSEQFILTEDGITRVSGKSVELEGAPNYDFFLFKRSDGLYSITEKSTGLSLAKGKSQAGTKTIAENVLTQHRDRIDQTISDTPKIEVVQNKKIVQSVEPTPEKLEKDIKEENIGDGYPTTVSMRLADIVRSITPKDPDFEKFVINIEKALKRGIEARDFDSMIESVKELSEKDLNDTQWRELRKYYNVQTSSEPVNQGLVFKKVVGYEGKGRKKKPIYKYIIEDRGVVDHRNRRIIKTRPFSMFDNVTGGWKRAHQVVEIKNGEKTVTMNIFDSKDLRNDIGTMIEAEHKNGYYYHSGVKDHDTFMFLPYQVEVSEIKDGMSRMHKLFGAASKKDIDNDYQVWKRVYFDELPKGVNEKQLREMYDRSYLSNVKVYEGLNKKSLEDMLDANAKAKKADIGQQTSEVEVEVTNEKYSRNSLDNDSSSMYLFTDNAERTSRPTASSPNITEGWYAEKYKDKTNKPLHYGSTSNPTSAVIRGKNNAYPISTMSAYGTNWTNENFDLFKDTIDDEIGQIKQDLSKFKTLKLGDFRIGQGGRFAKLPSQHQSYLDSKLLELGIDNAGNSPKVSKPTQQTSEVGVPKKGDTVTLEFYFEKEDKIVPVKVTIENIEEIEQGRSITKDNKGNIIEERPGTIQYELELKSRKGKTYSVTVGRDGNIEQFLGKNNKLKIGTDNYIPEFDLKSQPTQQTSEVEAKKAGKRLPYIMDVQNFNNRMQLYDAGERTFDPKMYKAKSSKVPHTTIDALESWKKEFPNMEGTTDVDKSSRLWQYYGQPGERGLLKNLLAEISNAKNEETDLSGLDHTTLFRMGFNDADGNIIGKQPGEVNFKESHAYDNSVKLTIIGDKVHVFFRPDLSQVDFVGRRTWEDDTAINYMWDAVESLGKELNLPNNTELVNESSFKLPKKLSDIGYKQKGAEETPLTHLNVMLINGVPKQSDKRINHNREPYVFKTTEGDRIGENHIDSPVMVEQQLFDQILRDAGIHPDAGAAKGVIRFANEESGALLAKLLYVRAGDKESAEMREADVHMKLTDTAVKQSGERQAYDHFYDGVKMTYSQDKVSMEPEKYSLPLDAFTLNNGVYEDPVSFKKDQILVGQFLSNMTKLNVDEKVLGDYIKRIENENIQGDKAINNIVKRGVHDEMFDANGEFRYDIEDVSLDIISDIVGNKEVADSPMYRAIWRHIRRLENIDADEVDIDLGRKVLSELNLTETVTDRLLRLWEPTPATIHFPLNEQSNNAMLSKYLTRRILKPKVKHSGKAFMMPYDAYLQENIDLQPGEFWLNDGYKDKIVKVRGEKMTLENALKIKDLTDQEREMVLVRVPASSISGIRTLIFKGFTGRKGVGVLLHDKDMEALGGADLDGDSAFIYQDIDPALRSEIKKNENEWTDKNGKDKMVKNKTARKILDIQPMPGERLKAVHTFDPYSRLDIARKAYQGKKLVGVVNNMKKRLAVIESMLNEKGELDVLFSNFLKEGGKPSPFAGIRIKFFPERQMGYREMLHNMVNFAVDSAKENGLPDPFVLMEKIYDKTLEASYIDKDGHIVQDAKLSDTIMGYLQHFDKTVTNGYDYKNGKLYTLQEKIDAAKDLVDYIDKNNLDKSSPVYNQAKSVASLTYDGRIESWLNIEAAKNLLNSMNKIFKNQSQLPEVERLKDLVFREIYPTFKKSAEAENDFYNEIVGLASVKEIFKESQKILSKVEDPDGVALELRKIAEKTDYFKRTINKLVTAGQEDPSVYTTKNKVLEKVNAELVKYKDSLPEEYKAFFDQYFIGAIFSQTKLPTGGDVQLYSYGIDHPAVSDASIARLGRSLNKLVRQVNEGKSDKFIESLVGSDALKKINNPELKKAVKTTKEFEQPVVARTKAATVVKTGLFNTRKRMELVKTEKEIKALKKKLTSVDLASELTAEGMKLSADMTEILQRHPEIEKDFDAIFAGVTGLRTAEGSMKHGIHPKAATLEDIRDFVDFYKHYKQSDKPVGLNRLTFWMFPSYARDRLSKVDLQYFNISKYPVKMPNGVIKNINVRYPMSSIGRDMKYSDGISSFTDQHTDRRGKMLVKEFSFLDNYGVKGEDLVDIAMSIYEKDTGAGKTGKNFKLYNEYYENAMKKLDTEFKDEKFELLEGNKKTLLSAKQVVDRIIKRHHALNKEFYSTWVRLKDENGEFVDEWADYRDKRGNIILDKALKRVAFPIYEGVKNREVTLNALMELGHETILNYMEVTGKNGKSVLALNLPKAEYLAHMKRYKRLYSYRPIGEQENHFPHNGHPRHIQEAYRKNRLEEMEKRGASKAEITQANMEMLSKQMDSEMYDMNLVHPFQTLIMDGKVNEKALEIIGLSRRIGHAQSRDTKNGPMPEWNKSVSAINFYQQQIIKGYANILHALGTHRNIHNFESKQLAGKETTNWARYMKLRLMTDIGYPSVIPQEWLSDPTFKVKGTPFNFFSDQGMEQKMLKISKKLGIKPWWNPERPEEMYYKLRVFANLEAKYSLLTLLSRPKAATNNLMGGMTFTGISAGFHPLMTAMSLKKVRETIPGGKDFHGWSDVFDWANVSGATESWLISMIGHTPLFKTGKWARFGERALTVIKKDPMVSDRTIRDIAREEGLSDALVQKGASFMLFAERRLRTISFVAHYIKGMGDLYGDKGRFKRDDPWLVNYALRGVEASQFLYNNAKRPIFGAVTIGRTYARFQLWGWNAIKNKKDIAKAANSYGFRPGTDEYVKFKRMITTDMFVMALGTLFTASLFESTMPPPYSFLQDFASLLFGDKKERDKAFFGTLPAPFSAIQMISPPSARLLLQPLGNLMKGDWERFTDYQVWSWAPFGLLSRDVIRTVENPTMGIENMTGIPVHGFHRYLRKEREKISTSPHLFYNSDKEESQQ